MKKIVLSFKIVFLSFIFVSLNPYTYAQDIDKVRTTLTAAREAYDGGKYRTAIDKIKELEQLIGSTTKPVTSYIKIMSYYKLKDYASCVQSAEAYLGDKPKQDETLEEIRKVLSDSQIQAKKAKEANKLKSREVFSNNSIKRESIYNYSFDDEVKNRNWKTNTNKVSTSMSPGNYFEIKIKTGRSLFYTNDIIIDQSKDFEIEAVIKYGSKNNDVNIGLFWGGLLNNSDNFFKLAIRGKDRRYIISKLYKNEWFDNFDWRYTANYVNSGFNKLTVRKFNNMYYYFVNGYFVYKTSFEKFYGPSLGLYGFGNTIVVKHISVSYLTDNN